MPEVVDNEKVGRLIKQYLKERNMTQEELANRLSISKSAVSQNLSGKSSFDIQNLMKIADIFNVSLDTLLQQKSNKDESVVSEYERFVRQGMKAFDSVKLDQMQIGTPDLYGKVLIEYVIEYENVEMFKHLIEHNVVFYQEHHHNARYVHALAILFSLQKKTDHAIRLIKMYVSTFDRFEIPNETLEKAIFHQLEDPKHGEVLRNMMEDKVEIKIKMLKAFNMQRHRQVVKQKEWIAKIAQYHLDNVLSVYFDYHKSRRDYGFVVDAFLTHQYDQGLKTYLERVPNDLSDLEKMIMTAQAPTLRLVQASKFDLFTFAIERNLYENLTTLATTLIKQNQLEYLNYLLEDHRHKLKTIDVAKVLVKHRMLDQLRTIITDLDSDQRNQLLSIAHDHDYPMIIYLMRQGAKFNLKHQDSYMFDKINGILQYLLKEGEDKA